MHQPFLCLDPKTDVFGPHLLEASAGTGKTFTIEHLFVRFLLESDSLLFDQILAVTFTRAAVAELKARILSNLDNALYQLKENQIDWLYLEPFAKNKESMRKLEDALSRFDQAQIHTIHGFCLKMLKEFAFEAKAPFQLDILSSKAPLRKVITDFIKEQINPLHVSISQLSLLRKDSLVDDLLQTWERGLLIRTVFVDQWKTFNEKLLHCPYDFEKSKFVEHFLLVEPFYRKTGFKEIEKQVELLGACLEKKSSTKEEFDQFIQMQLTVGSFFSEKNRKKKPVSITAPHPVFNWTEEYLQGIVESARNNANILQTLAYDADTYIQRFLEEKELLTHDSTLKVLLEALKNTSFKEDIREKFRIAIIDEFQDTDPIQWEIFQKLFYHPSMLALYLVGDPKQSIYRFRNADVYTYEKAKSVIGDQNCYSLNTNFRSSEYLVNSLNRLFSLSGQWLHLPKLEKSLSYVPVNVGRKDLPSLKDDQAALHFFVAQEKKDFFPFIANEVMRLQKDFAFTDMAVLVKDWFEADALRQFFSQANIPCITKSRNLLCETSAALFLEQLLQAALHFPEQKYVKVAMAGPYIGSSMVFNEQMFTQWAKMQQALKERNLPRFFREFFQSTWRKDKKTVLELLASEKDLILYRDTIQLMEVLFEFSSEKKLSTEGILQCISELKKIDPDEDKRVLSRLCDDHDAVQIQTIHSSKGLEYEVVFALGIASSAPVASDQVEENEERKRQLYVALTRGKQRVYVPILLKDAKKRAPSAMQLFSECILENIQGMNCVTEVLAKHKEFTHTIIQPALALEQKWKKATLASLNVRKSFTPHWNSLPTHSFSSLAKNKVAHLESMEEGELPRGPEIGAFIHSLLEKTMRGEKIEDEVFFNSPYSEWENRIKMLLKNALFSPLAPKDFCLNEVPVEFRRVEMEFLFSKKTQGYFKGFIDLVFFYKNQYYLLDWKSNWLGSHPTDYCQAKIKQVMQEHQYELQANIYVDALRRYVQLIDNRPFEESFGGVFYVFLRGLENGSGIYHFFPKEISYETF